MFGVKPWTALLFSLSAAAKAVLDRSSNNIDGFFVELKQKGYLRDGRIDFPVAEICNPILPPKIFQPICTRFTDVANAVHEFESGLLCEGKCGAKYNPLTELCQCSWGSPDEMKEGNVWPSKQCTKNTVCYAPFTAHWNPRLEQCTCAVETYPKYSDLIHFEPNAFKEYFYGPHTNEAKSSATQMIGLQGMTRNEAVDLAEWYEKRVLSMVIKKVHNASRIESEASAFKKLEFTTFEDRRGAHKRSLVHPRQTKPGQTVPDAVSLAPLPTYIPPPNTEVTQELIQESLLMQPQHVAIVSSVIPHFADGIISFLVQLDGPISQTLTLNATDTLPCGNIGSNPPPVLMLSPKNVKNGTQQTVLPDCLVIAVNMYDSNYITYWVQRGDGSVFSLLGDSKIQAIDQLDTSLPASIAIRVASNDNQVKRAVRTDTNLTTTKRYQIYSIECEDPCPFYHMEHIEGSDGHCGCMFKSVHQNLIVAARSVEQPSPYTATMTSKTCETMACINNGGKPALFNPFTATCWCASPTYVEENENAYFSGV